MTVVKINLGCIFCLRMPRLSNHCNVQVFCYGNNLQHGNILVYTMEKWLVTNIYQVDQHGMDMHMETKKYHRQLFQVLD